MSLNYRQLSERLKVGIWSSPAEFMRESEEYIAATNFDRYNFGTRLSDIRSSADFYGFDPNSSLTVEQQYSFDEVTKFSNPTLLRQSLDTFEDVVTKIDFGGNLNKSKMEFTSIPQGVFNFGLASKGLIRPVEYYSIVYNKIIPSEKVLSVELNGGKTFYFKDDDDNDSPLRLQQEGTFLVEKNCGNVVVQFNSHARMFLPYKDGSPYIGCGVIDSVVNKPSRLRFTTTVKKVYMYREKIGGGLSPYVDLFLVVGGLGGLSTEQMLIKNLPILVISQFLNAAGIKTRILALRGYEVGRYVIDYAFVVKDYGESLDTNQIAAFTSDVRFFRVNLWNLVPALVRKREGVDVTGYGTTLYGRNFNSGSADDLIPSFNMFKNWAINSSQKAVQSSKVTDPRLMIVGGIGSIVGSDTLTNPNTIQKITDEIYRIGDYISLMFTKNARKTIGAIYDRELDRQSANVNKMAYINNYLRQTILDNLVTIRPSQVANADFATPPKLLEEIDEQSITLLQTLKEFTK
jgi:hypothetical protein